MPEVTADTSARVMWPSAQRIQWGCALMDLLGETNLERLPLVLSGSRAVESSAQASAHTPAIRRARQLLGKLLTRRAVKLSVLDLYVAHENRHKPGQSKFNLSYDIDPTTLSFTPLPGEAGRIRDAKQHLAQGTVSREHHLTFPPAGTTDLVATIQAHSTPLDVPIRLTSVEPHAPPQHDLTRRPAGALRITLDDLRRTARRLDDLDEGAEWVRENWLNRLNQVIHLYRRTARALEPTNVLDLEGIKHLIGLPGAGKTTLISLLCATLALQDKRVCVFFTSIEMAREYLEKLRRYGVSTAMLVGSSPATQRRHGERLAELIATKGDGGFGHTHSGADLFAQTCPLPAFAVDEARAWEQWGAAEAPCEQIRVPGQSAAHLCPLWSRCGRVKNQRDLVGAHIWLGHIRSADTAVPAHTSRERLNYFQLIARTFDLIIVDEADHTQHTLDEMGSVSLTLGGHHDSVHAHAQQVTQLAMTGRLKVHDDSLIYRYQHAANNFERHLLRFHEEVNAFEHGPQEQLGLQLKHRLLTTNFLINRAAELLGLKLDSARLSAIYAFWDSAIYTAYFRREPDDQPSDGPAGVQTRPWAQVTEMAQGLDLTVAEAERRWLELRETLREYISALDQSPDLKRELGLIEAQFAALLAPPGTSLSPAQLLKLAPLTRLNVAVGFTIAAYQNLVRMTRPLSQYNILPEAIGSSVSKALESTVARNLLGTFSSVSYRPKEEGEGFDINYLILDTAPRLLLHRLHEQGANVLLTSATSWMPDSTSYHINHRPDYVLKPKRTAEDTLNLRLRFAPIAHPSTGEPLRYSGAGAQRTENLKLMVRHLARPGIGLSPLEKAARQMETSQGRPRMVALVVNSYDQVRDVVRMIAQVNPDLAAKTRGVLPKRPAQMGDGEHYVLRGQVETLGQQEDVTVLIFPLTALGRGVNIVFNVPDKKDPDNGRAAVGSVYFLIRPHPVVGDLTLMLSHIARQTQEFDAMRFPNSDLLDVQGHYLQRRVELYTTTMQLLARTMSASRLPKDFLAPFAANLLIPILQTIGRAIRRSSPADVFFVDAAWAPRSAQSPPEPDDNRSSVLVAMQQLLNKYVSDPDPAERAVMEALYRPFADAFSDIEDLNTGGYSLTDEGEYIYPPVYLDDDGDLDNL